MTDTSGRVAVVGVGKSQIGRRLSRPVAALAVDAALAAIADAGLEVADIDGLSTFPQGAGPGVGPEPGIDAAPVEWMVAGLGITRVDWWTAGGGNISTAVLDAVNALATRRCTYVLVWRAMHQPRKPVPSATGEPPGRAEPITGSRAYVTPYGFAEAPALFAAGYMRYMKLYGARREHMAVYATTMRANAHKNPDAVFSGAPLTFDEYMSSRMISDPLCLHDCDMPVDGAGAIVLARADRARHLARPPAYVSAVGSAGWDWRLAPPEEWLECTAANIGRTLWRSTSLTPSDMSAAMLYDGFSPDIYWWLEGLGFCERGEAFEWIQGNRIARDGELPVNTFGGQISEGRLHGIGHWIEGVLQIQERADDSPGDGARQVADAENVLVATGMMGHGAAAILSRDPR